MRSFLMVLVCSLWLSIAGIGAMAVAANDELEITVLDKVTGQPVPVRMHLKDQRGRPVLPPRTVAWRTHFIVDGKIRLKLRPGRYTFEIERGPEYRIRYGDFTIKRGARDSHRVEMERFVDMKREGWWSGELHVHRPRLGAESLDVIELLMRAEDLHVAPVITWWNNRSLWADREPPASPLVQFDENRFYHLMAGEDEREGGALLYFNLTEPLDIRANNREHPSPVAFLEQARRHAGVHVDIEKPFWWDVPVWVATGQIDSIGLAHNHLHRDGVLPNEAWGKPRDAKEYPGPLGNGRWSQDIYYHLLNCGLRIPPSAGSASGVLPNPVGYNRVYVYCGEALTYDKWFEGLRAGRVVVTNGPLLRPRVNGQLPGHLFADQGAGPIELDIALDLSLRDKIEQLEIIKNGRVVHAVSLREYAQAEGKLPRVVFQSSGWMLVRAVTSKTDTFRFASTGPYYVEIGGRPRISKRSAQFFLDWVNERAGRVKIDDPEQREDVLKHHRAARIFWQDRVDRANVD